jgi:hypothetical protein
MADIRHREKGYIDPDSSTVPNTASNAKDHGKDIDPVHVIQIYMKFIEVAL